ncbi:hypothetical protein CR513_38241, partial [Mucuna pruriens]
MEDNTNQMENKGKKGKSKENDDDCVTTATGDDLVILRDFESVSLVFDESMWTIDSEYCLVSATGRVALDRDEADMVS